MENIKFDSDTNIVYLDMDGVIADFDKAIIDIFGKRFDQNSGVDDSEMWNVISKIDRFYFTLEPTPYAHKLFDAAKSVTKNVEILTAIPSNGKIKTAREDKKDWVKKHFGDSITVNFGPYSKDKWKHCRNGDILIDDRKDNISDWKLKGQGIGILHVDPHVDKTIKVLNQYG